jgi:hypothetical protein
MVKGTAKGGRKGEKQMFEKTCEGKKQKLMTSFFVTFSEKYLL